MARLELLIEGYNDALNSITINQKLVKITSKKGERKITCDCKNGECEVVIYKGHQYQTKNWFWWNLLYFFISIFGIFDIFHDKKFMIVDCRFKIDVSKDTKATIKVLNYVDGGKFAEITSEDRIEEIENIRFQDKEGKKKHKTMKKFKLAFWLSAIVITVALVILI